MHPEPEILYNIQMTPLSAPAVLIVDDELALAELMVDACAALGKKALMVPSVVAAKKVMAETPTLRLALIDINLAGENGFDVALHARTAHPDIACVLVSGSGDLADRAAGFEDAAIYRKPLRLEFLAALLERIES